MGSLSGGDKLQKRLDELAKRLNKKGVLRVGFLEDATYPDGTSVASVAAFNEYGRTVKSKDGDYFQMPRPFFRDMIRAKSGKWPTVLGELIAINDGDTEKALKLMGEGIRGQLQKAIQTYNGPPLAQSTIDRKGFDKQLVDTSVMVNSVDYQVLGGDES